MGDKVTPEHTLTRSDEALIVRVVLPDIRKASEVDLAISDTRLHLIAPPRYGSCCPDPMPLF